MSDLNSISGVSASALLAHVKLTEPPFDSFEVAARLGLNLDETLDFDRMSISGEIGLDKAREPLVWINPLDPPNRRRFTMAHELGHLVNDILPHIAQVGVEDCFSDPEMNLRRDGRQDPKEFAANEFAADLLMPKDHVVAKAGEVIGVYRKKNGAEAKISASILVAGLASIFEVSHAAMEIRLKRIGAIR